QALALGTRAADPRAVATWFGGAARCSRAAGDRGGRGSGSAQCSRRLRSCQTPLKYLSFRRAPMRYLTPSIGEPVTRNADQKETQMTHHSKLDRRRGGRPRVRGFAVIVGMFAIALALAACGSSSSSTSSASSGSSGSSGATATNASSGSGSTSAAASALSQYKTLPTSINITTPLKSAPPAGKTIVMLGTNNPSNVLIQQGMSKLAK